MTRGEAELVVVMAAGAIGLGLVVGVVLTVAAALLV